MRHIREPFTMAVHSKLLHEINEMSIAIKLHHFDLSKETDQDAVQKAKASVMKPTWENVEDLLIRCRKVIDTIRENPIKY